MSKRDVTPGAANPSTFPTTIEQAADLLRAGSLTSEHLTATLLQRAHTAQDTLGAFITLVDDAALAAARQADRELAAGVDRGPLHGIPLGIKDIFFTVDAPTTANSRVHSPAMDARLDASSIRNLRQAGAIVLGKNGLSEFAVGGPDPTAPFPIPRNPWDTSRIPGYSSSGTAAAIAGGLVLGGLASDTGGSVSIPAAYCGLSGIKPTYGRVSRHGCIPLAPTLDHVGPLARTAHDCAVMLEALVRPSDHTSNDPLPLASDFTSRLADPIDGLRIGVPQPYFYDSPDLSPEVRSTVLAAAHHLALQGAVVENMALPHAEEASSAQFAITLSESFAGHERNLRDRSQDFGAPARRRLQLGALITAADYVQAQRVRTIIRELWLAVFADLDVIIVPTTLNIAPPFSANPDTRLATTNLTSVWNLSGFPAMSIPCGFSTSGLPIGMEIVGKPFDEATVLHIAHAYQQGTDWHMRSPDLPWLQSP